MTNRIVNGAFGLESLEGRRLLSTSFIETNSFTDPNAVVDGGYGFKLATQGDLALIGSPAKTIDVSGNPEQYVGEVQLVDTTTGQVLRTFDNPNPSFNDGFGSAVAFVGDRIAISAPGEASVYIYEDYSDTTPVIIFDQVALDNFGDFGSSLAAYGNNLLVSTTMDYNADPNPNQSGNGSIRMYDADTGDLLNTIRNPIAGDYSFDSFGFFTAVDGDTLLAYAFMPNEDPVAAPFGFEQVVVQYDLAADSLVRVYNMPGGVSDFENFGLGLAVEGNNILIGAPSDDPFNPTAIGGVVYHFDATTGDLLNTFTNPEASDPFLSPQAGFGFSVDIEGDLAAIGANRQFTGNLGAVYVYDLSTGALEATITNPTGPDDGEFGNDADEFGRNVRWLSNGNLVVANPNDDAAGLDSGTVHVFSEQVVTENNPPVASATVSDATPNEGETIILDGSGSSDPDANEVLIYDWDFNYDGVNFDVNASGEFASTSYANGGTRTIALRVTDGGGLTSIATVSVAVQSAPPVAALAGPSTGVKTFGLTFNGSFTDATPSDTHQVSWNFGDGNTIAYHSSTDPSALSVSHAFANAGTYTVAFSVKDAAGNVSTATKQVVVSSVGIVGGDLYVLGNASSANVVGVTTAGSGVNVNLNGTNAGNYSPTGQIRIIGGSGIDLFIVDSSVTRSVLMDGGAGLDILRGGSGNDIILGGAGSDLIVGGNGRDLLIGGADLDLIIGDGGDDILIGGTTSHSHNYAALNSIQSIWTGSGNYAARRAALLSSLLVPDVTVFDDNATDILTGSAGQDWFFGESDSSGRDLVLDRVSNEVFNDVDVVSLL